MSAYDARKLQRYHEALTMIASGTGPIGGRLGYDQMREIAREAVELGDTPIRSSPLSEAMQPLGDEIGAMIVDRHGKAYAILFLAWIKAGGFPKLPERLVALADPPPPMIVRDLIG